MKQKCGARIGIYKKINTIDPKSKYNKGRKYRANFSLIEMPDNTEAADLVVIVLSTATGARVGSTVDVCVRQGSRSMVPPPF